MKISSTHSLWHPVSFEPGDCRYWEIGPLHFWVIRNQLEWHVSYGHENEMEDRFIMAEPCDPPSDVEWERWAAKDDDMNLHLTPVLADRPIIARPEDRLHIPPGDTVQFFVGLPIWIRLGKTRCVMLRDLPTRILSNSWFGNPTQGELCYMSATRAKRALSELQRKPFRVYSTIDIRNNFTEILTVQRICVRVPYLNVYQGDEHLWTNGHRIIYQGPNSFTKLVMSRNGPNYDNAGDLVGLAREKLKRGLFASSLGTLNPLASLP